MLPNGVTPANVMWLGVGTLGLMSLMGGLTESRREINWHKFKYQLLEQKLVPPSPIPLPTPCLTTVTCRSIVSKL